MENSKLRTEFHDLKNDFNQKLTDFDQLRYKKFANHMEHNTPGFTSKPYMEDLTQRNAQLLEDMEKVTGQLESARKEIIEVRKNCEDEKSRYRTLIRGEVTQEINDSKADEVFRLKDQISSRDYDIKGLQAEKNALV